jgi:uncharacterized OsmC-like protein
MVHMRMRYEGSLSCTMTHQPSGGQITTDAPTDNRGLGRTFSPTDLCASSLGSCILTTMGIYALDRQLDLTGMVVDLEKVMSTEGPRRITIIRASITMPNPADEKTRTILERVGRGCPVSRSLHPDIAQEISFHWPEEGP